MNSDSINYHYFMKITSERSYEELFGCWQKETEAILNDIIKKTKITKSDIDVVMNLNNTPLQKLKTIPITPFRMNNNSSKVVYLAQCPVCKNSHRAFKCEDEAEMYRIALVHKILFNEPFDLLCIDCYCKLMKQ